MEIEMDFNFDHGEMTMLLGDMIVMQADIAAGRYKDRPKQLAATLKKIEECNRRIKKIYQKHEDFSNRDCSY